MKSTLLLALLVFILAFIAGCKAPDTSAAPKDSTNKLEKKTGGSDE